jgi:hypothetical protein
LFSEANTPANGMYKPNFRDTSPENLPDVYQVWGVVKKIACSHPWSGI